MQPEMLIATGRVVLGLFFVIAAIRNMRRFTFWTTSKTNYGWPVPVPALMAGFALQLVAGIALAADFQTVWASLALVIFLLVATPLYHNPLMFRPEERGLHVYFDLVNTALVAYLLQIIGHALAA